MKHHSLLRFSATAALALLVAGSATEAFARGRTREGAAGSRQVNRQRGDVDRSTTRTNRNGDTATHEFHRDVDAANKTVTVDAATTRANGDSAGRHLVTEKTATGTQTTGEIDRFNGNTVTVDATKTRTETGVTRNATFTGENGKPATVDSVRTRTDDGFTRDTVATGPNGKTATTNVDVSKDGNTITRDVTRTAPNGTVTTKTQTQTKTVTPAPGS